MSVKRHLILLFVTGICLSAGHYNEQDEWVEDQDPATEIENQHLESVHIANDDLQSRSVDPSQIHDISEDNPQNSVIVDQEHLNQPIVRKEDDLNQPIVIKQEEDAGQMKNSIVSEDARGLLRSQTGVLEEMEEPAVVMDPLMEHTEETVNYEAPFKPVIQEDISAPPFSTKKLDQNDPALHQDINEAEERQSIVGQKENPQLMNRSPSLVHHEEQFEPSEGRDSVIDPSQMRLSQMNDVSNRDTKFKFSDALVKKLEESNQNFEEENRKRRNGFLIAGSNEGSPDLLTLQAQNDLINSETSLKQESKKAAHLSNVQADPIVGAPPQNINPELSANQDKSLHSAQNQLPHQDSNKSAKESQSKPQGPNQPPKQENLKDQQKPADKTAEEQKKLDEAKKKDEKPQDPPKKPLSITEIIIHIFLAVTGAYVCLFGFRAFRLLMIILGFYTSYYVILFFMSEFEFYQSQSLTHQLGLFFGSIILGFFIAVICYIFDRSNFFVFGLAVGCVVGLFYAQFFVDFDITKDRLILLAIVLCMATLITLGAFFMLDQAIIWGSAVVGAIICPINVGVLVGDFASFEDRKKLPLDAFSDFKVYLIVCGALLLAGVGCQYYLRSRIISHMHEENLNQIRGESFLN